MRIVIVGGTSGIGRCLTSHLALNNSVFVGSRDGLKVSTLIDSINRESSYHDILNGSTLDASNFSSVESFLHEANESMGGIDAVINCAGSLLLKPPHLIKEDEMKRVFEVNAFSCIALLKYGFKYMKQNGGSFVFFSSAASKVGLRNHEVISGAKGAISSIAVSAASTYSSFNIRVNAIAPGLVDTPLTERITSSKVSLDYSRKLHGLNKIGKPENFLPIVSSLIDPNSDWLTGQTIYVDGGLSNVK